MRSSFAAWHTFPIAMAAAAVVLIPFVIWGNASGHDFEFHVASWMDVAWQWQQGVLYPRWANFANFGFGEPRFIFYPPASWLLGAALGRLLQWRIVPGSFVWLVLTTAGITMFLLARDWMPSRAAALASIFYAINPYHLLVVYLRSAYGELLASALFPLSVFFFLRICRSYRSAVPGLAAVFAAIWLANAPAAVIVSYSLTLLSIVQAINQSSLRVFIASAGSMALGFVLAAFYILPALYEQSWVNIAQAVSLGLRPQDNFLFTIINDLDHNRFNFIASMLAVAEISITGLMLVASCRTRSSLRESWWMMATLSILSAALMFSATRLLWQYLPKLNFVQLPWRWLFPLNLGSAFLFGALMAGSPRKTMWFVLVAVVTLTAGITLGRLAYWDSEDVPAIASAIAQGRGYEGAEEYTPVDCHSPEILRSSGEVSAAGASTIHIEGWGPEQRSFSVSASQPTRVAPRILDYPAWRIEVNGQPVQAGLMAGSGQMVVSVPSGHSRVQISFIRTIDRMIGAILSVIGLLTWSVILFLTVSRSPRANVRELSA